MFYDENFADYDDYDDYDDVDDYDDMNAYDNDIDYDYDPFQDPSSLEYQMFGYGGFGYNTDHVKPNDEEPDIVKAANEGRLDYVKSLVEAEKTESVKETPSTDDNVKENLHCYLPSCKETDLTKLKKCKRCQKAWYCGREHQKDDWRNHKLSCRENVGVLVSANAGVLANVGQKETENVPKDAQKRRLLNMSRRWTEVDYRMSGFTKEYEWHDLTPVASAANNGHCDVVEYLLREGADPTLEGCPDDNVHHDALASAKAGEEKLYKILALEELNMDTEFYLKKFNLDKSSEEVATSILKRQAEFARCFALLEAAAPFWKQPTYGSSRYNTDRTKSGFPNNPSDFDGLITALEVVPQIKDPATEDVIALATKICKLQEQRNEKMRKEQMQLVSAHNSQTSDRRGHAGRGRNGQKKGSGKKKKKCKFFASGSCRYGTQCRFSHE